MVLTSLLLGTALVHTWQNPNSPDVRVPEGWTVAYWGKTQSGRGGIKGPGGQEIGFPDYGSSGLLAGSVEVMNRDNVLYRLVLGGSAIDVALTVEGFLVVSYPPAEKWTRPGDQGFDYWCKVRSARETAQVLAIVLTRVEAMAERYRGPVPSAFASLPPSDPAYPFPGLAARHPVPKKNPNAFEPPPKAFDGVFLPSIIRQRGVSAPLGWTVRGTILSGALTVSEAKDGRLIAAYAWADAPSDPRSAVSFVGKKATARAALDAVIATITYREPGASGPGGLPR